MPERRDAGPGRIHLRYRSGARLGRPHVAPAVRLRPSGQRGRPDRLVEPLQLGGLNVGGDLASDGGCDLAGEAR
jgi:hypothetical protein